MVTANLPAVARSIPHPVCPAAAVPPAPGSRSLSASVAAARVALLCHRSRVMFDLKTQTLKIPPQKKKRTTKHGQRRQKVQQIIIKSDQHDVLRGIAQHTWKPAVRWISENPPSPPNQKRKSAVKRSETTSGLPHTMAARRKARAQSLSAPPSARTRRRDRPKPAPSPRLRLPPWQICGAASAKGYHPRVPTGPQGQRESLSSGSCCRGPAGRTACFQERKKPRKDSDQF